MRDVHLKLQLNLIKAIENKFEGIKTEEEKRKMIYVSGTSEEVKDLMTDEILTTASGAILIEMVKVFVDGSKQELDPARDELIDRLNACRTPLQKAMRESKGSLSYHIFDGIDGTIGVFQNDLIRTSTESDFDLGDERRKND